MDTCARTMITYAKTMDTCTKTMETCARIMDTCTGNMETCARIRRPAPESGDLRQNQETCTALLATSAVTLPHLRRSSSNEWYFSATPAPSLCRTGTVTPPHQHSYSAAPAPSLRRTGTVTLPHTFRHISSREAWRDSIRFCHRGKEPYLGFCRFVH